MKNLAILGAGNIGTAIAKGLIQSGNFEFKHHAPLLCLGVV